MFRIIILASPLMLGGCLMPAWFTYASLALDGVSYVSTGKSVSDHALSVVAGQDCATHRVLRGEWVCQDEIGDGIEGLAESTDAPKALGPNARWRSDPAEARLMAGQAVGWPTMVAEATPADD